MKRILLAGLGLFALAAAQPALAADQPLPYKAPPPAPIFNWSGFYVGGFLGGAWAARNATTADPCEPPPGVSCWNLVAPVSYPLKSSFIGGGTIGANWQMPGSAFVLGLEGEVGYLRLRGSAVMNPPPGGNSDTVASTTIGDWYAAYTARLGLASDRSLLYAKIGGVSAKAATGVVDTVGGTTLNTSTSRTLTGLAGGGGWEYAFAPNWSVKAEYLYLGIGKNVNDCGTSARGLLYCGVTRIPNVHTAKVGLNYRFGWH